MIAEDKILKEGLSKDFIQTPSSEFTTSLMEKIEVLATEEKIVEPLISKTQWKWIVFGALLLFCLSFVSDISNVDLADNLVFDALTDLWSSFSTTIYSGIAISCVLVILFGIDLIYRKRAY